MTKRFFSCAEVCAKIGWDWRVNRLYRRVRDAVLMGHAGDVARSGHSFVLDEANVRRLCKYLRQRWPSTEAGPKGPRRKVTAGVTGTVLVQQMTAKRG
jgi:hypothetical protein